MKITSVRVNTDLVKSQTLPDKEGTSLLAFASIVFDFEYVTSHIRVIRSPEGKKIVCMPSRVTASGHYRDVAYPITDKLRQEINGAVLEHCKNV